MEIFKLEGTINGYFVRVDEKEALKIIKSLVSQIAHNNPNSEREEFYTKKSEYFSIAVSDNRRLPVDELEIDYIYQKIQDEAKTTKAPWRNW